ncbi:sensor histidine kinase [Pseudonocardia sp. H11422]|uniref:sensor histidine kinase n=1 Tax=Pseudonocardia sp. H11422 TaxID=2835866 RepID=UPI001BDBECB3|nr:HAMP domain-containing sensor histidine kinase [Pseudonocardia sp. H11422]
MRFIADLLLVVGIGAVAGTAAVSPGVAASVDGRSLHLALAFTTAVVAGGIAILGVVGARALRHPRPAWLGAAFGLYGLVTLFLTVLGPRSLTQAPGLLHVMMAANPAVVVLLLVARRPPLRLGAWGAGAGAALAATLAVALGVVGVAEPLVGTALGSRAPQIAVAYGWSAVGVLAIAAGWRRRAPAAWRVGLGISAIAAAHLLRLAQGVGVAEPDLAFSALQLIGVLAVLGGSVQHLHSEMNQLFSERDAQRAELREAARHALRAADLARERDHELANGLAGLSGIAFLLEQPRSETDGPALRAAVLAELSRLHGILARPVTAAGTGCYDAADVITELAVLRRAAGMQIEVDLEGDLRVNGDRARFAQALTNLLANCDKHAPGSPVRMRAHRDAAYAVVEVHDDGPGISPGTELAVLERGVTGSDTGGSGLGLHVSARLLGEQGGGLRVLSRRPGGRGFGVRLELPAADPALGRRSTEV